jgi:hypothetical protein
MIIFAVIAVLFVCEILWLLFLIATAPEGYEDADGFHKKGKK